jgi:hypothetical protein
VTDEELVKLDILLNDFTVSRCDEHLTKNENCEGCYCYLPEYDDGEDLHCVLDRARIAVNANVLNRRLRGDR